MSFAALALAAATRFAHAHGAWSGSKYVQRYENKILMLHAALEPELVVSYLSMIISEHEVMCQGSEMIISQGSPSHRMGWPVRQPYAPRCQTGILWQLGSVNIHVNYVRVVKGNPEIVIIIEASLAGQPLPPSCKGAGPPDYIQTS